MNAIEPISSTSLANEAFHKVVEAITSGIFKSGEKLSEADIARQFGISRGPLREALGRLEGRLVTRTPRLGVRVIIFGKPELEQLFYLREALEGMAARLAAERMTQIELDSLDRLLDQHATRPEMTEGRAYVQRSFDDDFHFTIVRAARCERIEQILLDSVYYQLAVHRLRSSTRAGRAKAALGEHREIAESLHARDPEAAEAAMRRHIRNARFSVLAATEDQSMTAKANC
jgi:DNA-binding GntR family transcriptional regulator